MSVLPNGHATGTSEGVIRPVADLAMNPAVARSLTRTSASYSVSGIDAIVQCRYLVEF